MSFRADHRFAGNLAGSGLNANQFITHTSVSDSVGINPEFEKFVTAEEE
jgi:hypothetical protein